jgi:phosphonoacetate hydrolase
VTRSANASRMLIVVFDALRPEFVTADLMPNLHAFARVGVRYVNSRSTFPSETRVNQSAVTTGCYPWRHGIVANNFILPGKSARTVLRTGDDLAFEAALKGMTEPLFDVPTLGEIIAAAGKSYATVSAGTSGGGRLINISAEKNGSFRFALRRPDASVPLGVQQEIFDRIGQLPEYSLPALDWISYAVDCYLGFVEPELLPDVMLLWLCEPDASFHRRGIGSPDALKTIRHVDAEFGRIIDHHEDGIANGALQVITLSDHGQISLRGEPLNLASRFSKAGFGNLTETGTDELDIAVANAGGIWLTDSGQDCLNEIVRWLQLQDWCGPIFTRDGVEGTLRHNQVRITHRRAPDIAMALRYDQTGNEWGYKGLSLHDSRYPTGGGCHGGLSSFEMHNFLSMSGTKFKEGCEISVPAGNVDILPTVLHLLELSLPKQIDGRVLFEALLDGSDQSKIEVAEEICQSSNEAGSITHLSTAQVNGSRYINEAWIE